MTNETQTAATVSLEALEREWRTYAATAEQHADHSVAPENREWYMGRSEAFTECADALATLRLAQSGAVDSNFPARKSAQELFTEYFVTNYPGPRTIISDPNWHAPRIFRAACYALKSAEAAAIQPAPSENES